MERNFKLEIITPYRVFFRDVAEALVVVTTDGELEILAGHEPVAAPVMTGPVRVRTAGGWRTAAVSEGFLEVTSGRITVLVGAALWPEEVDVPRARRARARALEHLKDRPMAWEARRAKAALRRAEARLKIAGEPAASDGSPA